MTSVFSDDLKLNPQSISVQRVDYETLYKNIIDQAYPPASGMSRTPYPAKSILEVPRLIKELIDAVESDTPASNKVTFSSEEPDQLEQLEAITFSVARRQPGAFGQGAPFQSDVKNLRPILRDQKEDPNNPGYKLATLGYWHDNILRFTCCARTNWKAEERAIWFESIIAQYTWWLTRQGVSRFLFWDRGDDKVIDVAGNKVYCRVLDYFVRTETLTHLSTKKLEELVIKIAVIGG